MEIFIHRDDQDFGPYTVEEAQYHLATGDLVPEDHAWYEGAPDWMALEDIPGVVPASAAPEPKRTNTGLPAWIPPRRTEDPDEAGAAPFATPPRRLGIVVPGSTMAGRPVTPSRTGPPKPPPAVSPKPATSMLPIMPSTPVPAPTPAPAIDQDVAPQSPAPVPVPVPTANLRSLGLRNMIISGVGFLGGAIYTIHSYKPASAGSPGTVSIIGGIVAVIGLVFFLRGFVQFRKR